VSNHATRLRANLLIEKNKELIEKLQLCKKDKTDSYVLNASIVARYRIEVAKNVLENSKGNMNSIEQDIVKIINFGQNLDELINEAEKEIKDL